MTGKSSVDLEAILTRVTEVTGEQMGIPVDQISPDSRIVEDLNCDSLDLVELMMELEDQFEVTFPEQSDDPVYKAVFTRMPFRVRDFAELIYVRLHAPNKALSSSRWLVQQSSCPSPVVPFTQLSGRAHGEGDAPLLEPIEAIDHPYEHYRRRTDGMRCALVPAANVQIGYDAGELDEAPRHLAESWLCTLL